MRQSIIQGITPEVFQLYSYKDSFIIPPRHPMDRKCQTKDKSVHDEEPK